jgi:hypothetical protein
MVEKITIREKTIALAKSIGCEIEETADGSVYLNGPEGKEFASQGTSFIRMHDGQERNFRPSWKMFYRQVADEAKSGFIDKEQE